MSLTTHALLTQNWRQLASVQIGGAICLPLLIVGYELAKQQDPSTTLISIVWGNSFLFALALVAGFLGLKRKTTTAEHASFYFGKQGKRFFGMTLALSMLGWFAIQAQCMGTDLYHFASSFKQGMVHDSQTWILLLSLVLACLMIMAAFWGLTFLTRLSHFCVPLLVLTIGYAVYGVIQDQPISLWSKPITWWDGKGISLVLASSMAATIDLPTFYRHADQPRSIVWASIATYLIAMPLVQIAGLLLYQATQAPTISEALAHSSSTIWKSWTVLFLLIAGWTTNNINLYSASLSLTSLSKKMSFRRAMGVAGMIGVGLITIPVWEQFAAVLDLMGIFVVAMGSVVLMAFLMEVYWQPASPACSWLAWLVGITSGLCAWMNVELIGTGATVLDAGLSAAGTLLMASALLWLKNQLFIKKELCYENG